MNRFSMLSRAPWFWLICVVVISLPFWAPDIPPLTDVFGHIGRFTIQTNRGNATVLSEWYDFQWAVVPNLGADLIIEIFAPWFGVEPTTKALTIFIPTLNIIGLLLVSRETHGRISPIVIFSFPIIYHYALLYGFLNYSLSIALAFVLLTVWMNFTRRNQDKLKLMLFAGLSVLIWVCHLYGWAVMLVLIGAFELTRHIKRYGFSVRAIAKTSLPCFVLLSPLILKFMFPVESSGPVPTDGWFDWSKKIGWLIMVVRDRWLAWDIVYSIAAIGVLIFTLVSRKFEKDTGLILAGSIFMILFIFIPYELLGSKYADMRLVPVVMMVFLLSVRISEKASQAFTRGIIAVGLTLFVARLTGNVASTYLYTQELNAELEMLDSIPQGAELVTLVTKACPKQAKWKLHRLSHIGSLALSRKHAFSNDQWSTSGAHLVRTIRQESDYFKGDPSHKIYANNCREPNTDSLKNELASGGFDYLWIVSPDPIQPVGEGWIEIDRVKESRLYRYISAR